VRAKSKSRKAKPIEQPPAQLETLSFFPTFIYKISRPDFLPVVREVCEEAVQAIKDSGQELNEIYPAYMTGSFFADPRMAEFSQFVGQTAWNILNEQGYAMDPLLTYFTEMWCQEHYKHSAMEQHTHGFGAQIVGFYFVDCPENSSRVIIHDPKAAKVQIGLFERNLSQVSYASNMVNFDPEPGMMMFTNAWLPHSFSRHGSDKPMRFVHFNLAVQAAQTEACPIPHPAPSEVEIV